METNLTLFRRNLNSPAPNSSGYMHITTTKTLICSCYFVKYYLLLKYNQYSTKLVSMSSWLKLQCYV